MRVLILGAGGHGQVVVDVLRCVHRAGDAVVPIGYLDDDPYLWGQTRSGLPVLGSLEQVASVPHDALLLAIGDNRIRERIYGKLQQQGRHFATAVHPRSIVASGTEIGPGSVFCAGVIVNVGSRIGNNVILNTGCTIDHHNCIGDHVHIAPGAHLGGDVVVGTGALIGIGAIVLPQRKVGEGAVVGAASVVTKDVPPHTTWVGIPARLVRGPTREQYLEETPPDRSSKPCCKKLFSAELKGEKPEEDR